METRQDWCPRGAAGVVKVSHTRRGKLGDHWGGQRIKKECGQVSHAHLGPQEPAEIPGLILCPLRPPPATRVLRKWEGGKGEQK